MGREFKVLSLLRQHYNKVPSPVLYCEDPSIIGAPFYVMELLKGIILRPAMIQTMNISPKEMRRLSESLVDNLVVLHSIDIHATGLVQLGKPEGYIARQVEGWTNRYHASQTEVIHDMDAITTWLGAHQPVDGAPAFLHNDYKYDNIVFDRDNMPEIIGVLDWEMSTVGDPWMDLGATLAYWAEAGDGDLAKVFNISWLPGNLTRKEVVERYLSHGGRTVSILYFIMPLVYSRMPSLRNRSMRAGSRDIQRIPGLANSFT